MDASKVLILSLFAVAMNCSAEVYRWVDKNGKVHFTDRKPATDAENITADVKSQNIDTSSSELQKLTAIREQDERDAQEYARKQQKLKDELAEINRPECGKARARLKDISGHVVFIDDQGKVVTVSEKERQQMVAGLKQEIQQHCSE